MVEKENKEMSQNRTLIGLKEKLKFILEKLTVKLEQNLNRIERTITGPENFVLTGLEQNLNRIESILVYRRI